MPLENDIQELTSAIKALNDNLHHFLHQAKPEKPVAKKAPAKKKPAGKPKEDQPELPLAATKDEVITAFRALQAAKDSKAVKALLVTFDAKSMSDLDPDKYQDAIAAAQEAAA